MSSQPITFAIADPEQGEFRGNVRQWSSVNILSGFSWLMTTYYIVIACLAIAECFEHDLMDADIWAVLLTISPGLTFLGYLIGYTYVTPKGPELQVYDKRHMDPMFSQICCHFILTLVQMTLAWGWYVRWKGAELDAFNANRYDTSANATMGSVLLYNGWYQILTLVIFGLPLVIYLQFQAWRRHKYPLKIAA